jgi:flagellar secretion chaperone FliS
MPINPYLNSRVLTADRGQLLLMLYDGAIRFNLQAIADLEAGNKVKALGPMGRQLAIVQELCAMLDHSQAPEICANLERLYQFIGDCILQTQQTGEVAKLREADRILRHLRETWVLAVSQAGNVNAIKKTG